MKKLIEIDALTFGFGASPVIEDVSMDVFERDYILIMGPNGGGKTTLLKLLMGMYKPWSGTITFHDGTRDRIGYVPQFSSFNKSFPITVIEMALTGRTGPSNFLKKFSRADVKLAEDVLNKLHLYEKKNENINNLSGGEVQRLLICRALVSEPALLLLDEPTTSIDLPSQSGLIEILNGLHERLTIIAVTHDPTPFAGIYNHVACINRDLHYHNRGELEAGTWRRFTDAPLNCWGMESLIFYWIATDYAARNTHPTNLSKTPLWQAYWQALSADLSGPLWWQREWSSSATA